MPDETPEEARLRALVTQPSETLNVEYKRWIDPDTPAGTAKIVRGAFALRNRNGGSLVIGFDDKTLQPMSESVPHDVRGAFHMDKIQGLISKYASDLFEVRIDFYERNGLEHPIITVPEGVRTVVAAKRALSDNEKSLINVGDVYFRTLSSNGTPSTSSARPTDWAEILEICFENREADIGRFLRRHLSGAGLSELLKALPTSPGGTPGPPNLRKRCADLLSTGEQAFRRALSERTLTPRAKEVVEFGSWSVALVIDPPKQDMLPDQTFGIALASSNPSYTGWPVWLDSSGFSDGAAHPYVAQNAVEALLISLDSRWSSEHFEFMRMDPKGEFYLRRVLQDDLTQKVEPRTYLDPIMTLLRVAEAIAVGIAFGKALGWKPEDTRLGFAFRWQSIANRDLSSWANQEVWLRATGKSHDDEVTTLVDLSLDTPPSAIAPYVEQATRGLFVLFGGYTLESQAVEYWVQRLIERKL